MAKATDINEIVKLVKQKNLKDTSTNKEQEKLLNSFAKFYEKSLENQKDSYEKQADIVRNGMSKMNNEISRLGNNLDNVLGTEFASSINKLQSLYSIVKSPHDIITGIGKTINDFKKVRDDKILDKEDKEHFKKIDKGITQLAKDGHPSRSSISTHDKKVYNMLIKGFNLQLKDEKKLNAMEFNSKSKTMIFTPTLTPEKDDEVVKSDEVKNKVSDNAVSKKEAIESEKTRNNIFKDFTKNLKQGFRDTGGFLKKLVKWEEMKWMWNLVKYPLLFLAVKTAIKELPGIIKKKFMDLVPDWFKESPILKDIASGISSILGFLGGKVLPVLLGLRFIPGGKILSDWIFKGINKGLGGLFKILKSPISIEGIKKSLIGFKDIIVLKSAQLKDGMKKMVDTFKGSNFSFKNTFKSIGKTLISGGKFAVDGIKSLGSKLTALTGIGGPIALLGTGIAAAGYIAITAIKNWAAASDAAIAKLMKTDLNKDKVKQVETREMFKSAGITEADKLKQKKIYEEEEINRLGDEFKHSTLFSKEWKTLKKQLEELKEHGMSIKEFDEKLIKDLDEHKGYLGTIKRIKWDRKKFEDTIGKKFKSADKEIKDGLIHKTNESMEIIRKHLKTSNTESNDGYGVETPDRTFKSSQTFKNDKKVVVDKLKAGGTGYNYNMLDDNNILNDANLRITSKVRKGAITKSGNLSYHAIGQAADIAASRKGAFADPVEQENLSKFAKWAANSGNFTEVLWNTPGHENHVHIAWNKVKGGDIGNTDIHARTGISGMLMSEGFMQIGDKTINFGEENKKELLQITPEDKLGDLKSISDVNLKMMQDLTYEFKKYTEEVKNNKNKDNNSTLNNIQSTTVVPSGGDRAAAENVSDMKFFPTDVAVQNIIWMSRRFSGGY